MNRLGPDPFEEKPVDAVVSSRLVNAEGQELSEFEEETPSVPSGKDIDPHQMVMAVGVQFVIAGKVHEFDAEGLELPVRAVVLTETEHGPSLGEVIRAARPVPRGALPPKVFRVLRLANKEDLYQRMKNRELEDQIFSHAQEKAEQQGLPIKVVEVDVYHSGRKALVYFTSEDRVDFRELVRVLVQLFRLRIELRQVGARDAAKMSGGIGDCGRELCCSTFLRDFAPVSIRMAKDQGLALNPNKLAGQCGKLKCCLSYEVEVYKELGAALPKVGKKVSCASGHGTVSARNILKQEVVVVLDDGARVTCRKGEWEVLSRPGVKENDDTEGPESSVRHESIVEDDPGDDDDNST